MRHVPFLNKSVRNLLIGFCWLIIGFPPGLVLAASAAVPEFLWARQAGGTNRNEEAYGLDTDAQGNVYVAGTFFETATFGTNTLVAAGGLLGDMFLAKYDRSGALVWVVRAGGTQGMAALDVAVSSNGNSFVTGAFGGTVAMGSTTLSNRTFGGDIFVAKFDTNGNPVWARSAGGGGYDAGRKIVLDRHGNVCVAGYFTGTGYFGPYIFGGWGDREVFVVIYGQEGTLSGATSAGGPGTDDVQSLAVDPAGDLYVAGTFSDGTLRFATGQVLTGGFYNAFMAKFGPPLALAWAKTLSNNFPYALLAETTNSFYAAGSSSTNLFVARLDRQGNEIWSRTVLSTQAAATRLALDRSGRLYVGGFFGNYISFPTITLSNSAAFTPLVAAYELSGNFSWAREMAAVPAEMMFHPAAGLYMAGFFTGTATLDAYTLTAAGGRDIFVARLGEFVPVRLSASIDLGAGFPLNLTGTPGLNHVIEASSDLSNWLPLVTNAAPYFYRDTNTAQDPRRFYRGRWLQ